MKGKSQKGCFKCGGGHMARDCPTRTSGDSQRHGQQSQNGKGRGYGSSHNKEGKPPRRSDASSGKGSFGSNVPHQRNSTRSWLAKGIIEDALEEQAADETAGDQAAAMLEPGNSAAPGEKQPPASSNRRTSSESQQKGGGIPQDKKVAQPPLSGDKQVTFYEELGVPRDADEQVIRAAYRKKALETHPDKCRNEEERPEYYEKFQHLQKIYETLGFQRSRDMYDAIHLQRVRAGRILVLMDMNGSLLFKAENQDFKTNDFASALGGRQPDWKHKGKGFYLRPFAKDFLDAVLRPNSKLLFAIYTSRQLVNAEPQVRALGHATGRPQLLDELFALYAGDAYSIPDPQAGKFKSKRCLQRIWRDRSTCARAGMHLDHCNTLNLDSEARKLKDHPENGLVVPAYTADVVRRDATSEKTDCALLALRDYLLRLGLECHGDVRDYLRLFPFSTSGELKKRALPGIDQLMADDFASRLTISD